MTPTIYKPSEKNFNHNGLGFLSDCIRCDVTEEKNGKYELELEYPAISRFQEYFEDGYQIKAKPNENEAYHIFEIKTTYKDTMLDTIIVYAQSRTYKLGNRVVEYVSIDSMTGFEAMKKIEMNMDEQSDIELYSDINTVSSTTFEARNVLNCIAGEQGSLLQYWGGEIKREPFRLSLLKRRGKDKVGTVRYGKDLTGLKIKIDTSQIVTKCLPYADIQNGEGVTERIYGTPVYSDYLKNYPDICSKYIQFTEDQGVTDLKSLNKVAAGYFTKINPGIDKPKVNIELEIEKLSDSEEAKEFAKLRNYSLCDTFDVYHKLYKLDIETEIVGVVFDSLTEKNKKIIAGNAQMAFYQQQNNEFQELMKQLTEKKYMSTFVDYITDLINGVDGGSVLQYPKNRPHSVYWLDTDSRETAKDVVVINNKGIGFSRKGWKGPFDYGWTIDGILNAKYIQTGKIQADVFESSFNALGDVLRLVQGTFQIWNDNRKIMELAKTGMRFWDNNKEVGNIGTDGWKLGGVAIPDEWQDKMLRLSLGEYGEAISLLTKKPDDENKGSHGLMITKDGTIHMNGKYIDIYSDNTVAIPYIVCDTIEVRKKLTVKGQEIDPGQGGGTGGYPSEVTTQADKFAWDWWSYALANGYSKEAAAGILGNIQGEVGNSMNPDTEQVGGPAYGWVQWDGSAYPIDHGPTTWNGREYVQRLMNRAGIKLDYTTSAAQARLINWCMYNEQWIGQVAPTSVSNFKKITNVEQAAYAFEMNFERPAASHPERQGYARAWYEKFKDLKPSQGTGAEGLARLESLVGQRWGNGQCYAVSAEYSGYLGGCGLGAGTQYALSHVIGNTSAAADIGSSYDWAAVGWKVIFNPNYSDLVTGAIINWRRGGNIGSFNVDGTYGHTGVIYGLSNNRFQTYEQNAEAGQKIVKYDRPWIASTEISSIVIPPK